MTMMMSSRMVDSMGNAHEDLIQIERVIDLKMKGKEDP